MLECYGGQDLNKMSPYLGDALRFRREVYECIKEKDMEWLFIIILALITVAFCTRRK
jgi:hypothetical protein